MNKFKCMACGKLQYSASSDSSAPCIECNKRKVVKVDWKSEIPVKILKEVHSENANAI